jgi:hypothetical protein
LFIATNREQLESLARSGGPTPQSTLVLLLCSAGVLLFGMSGELAAFLQEQRAATLGYKPVKQGDEGRASDPPVSPGIFVIDEVVDSQ